MNVFIHEIKSNLKDTIVWLVVIPMLCAFFFSIYPAFSRDVTVMQSFLDKFPEEVRNALNLELGFISNVLSFYSFLAVFIVLCGAIQGLHLGLSLVAKEGSKKTADFLLTKPVSRTSILTSKLLAGVAIILVMNVWFVFSVGMSILIMTKSEFDLVKFLLISGSFGLVQILFFAGGFCAASVLRKIKSVLSISLTVSFLFFIISLFSNAVKDENMRFLTPFRYVDYQYVLEFSSYEWPYILAVCLLFAGFIGTAYFVFTKKDIHV